MTHNAENTETRNYVAVRCSACQCKDICSRMTDMVELMEKMNGILKSVPYGLSFDRALSYKDHEASCEDFIFNGQ